jgi:DNA-binding CsgD family transcriptional regulator
MERLSATDLDTVLDVARELGSMRDIDDLLAGVLPALRRLVACDTASFNEVAPASGEAIITAVDPHEILFEGAEELFGALAHENPLIVAAHLGSPSVSKFSDFISARQLHKLDIYDLIYSRIGVEHQIAFKLPAPSEHVVGFALNRGRVDFSERDRSVLEAVRPFVIQAYENAAAFAQARTTIAALQRIVEREAKLHFNDLSALGLTAREIQVLDLIADGLANTEIARELALSERTIAKHLEHIYTKLGVSNRTAAVARAREASARGPSH